MSTGPGGVASTQERGTADKARALNRLSTAYLVAVVAGAGLLLVPFHGPPPGRTCLLVFVALAVSASLVQLLVVQMPAHQAYYSTAAFFLAGALLLPPPLVALVVLIAHLPEWAKYRYPWYIQTFNIANYVWASVGAALVLHAVFGSGRDVEGNAGRLAVAGAAAGVTFVVVNHALLAQMLRLARGKSYRESGLFTFASLSLI